MPVKELEKRFEPMENAMGEHEALAEAGRCLFCYDAPCSAACPAGISVPDFIRRIRDGNIKGSARQLYETNYLAGGCARVCPTKELCEGACVLNQLHGRPIPIGRLQRYATDWAIDNRAQILFPGKTTGKRVAVIGAGPAGYSCAAELARLGHRVEIFEARRKEGGLYTHAIARYKISSSFALKELRMLKNLGIRLKTGTRIGADIPFETLLKKYDAVFLGIGRGSTASLNIPGEDLQGVVEGLSFLEKTRSAELDKISIGKRVVVVGGGNTAVDAAIAAGRLGALDVMVLYRRSRAEMPAYKDEQKMALVEGVRFIWLAAPVRILGEKRVGGLKCVRMRLSDADSSGRPRPVPIPGSEFTIECDMVIAALGQVYLSDILSGIHGLKLENGRVVVNNKTGATSVEKLFAGGDCATGGGEMVDAVAEGIRAARGIHESFLMKSR
ncbi:MAG TPA: NAD(P)-dependent oxidoreductase [Candidatus Sumerlaeota bacterium]|nr:NAD(P)-dependent oxidoreductase [Candidatus Sumerlaeota bacterium]HON50331.1 NAD(P)-dependent oxidoreductase [Candidatus Sumerlaeota bacterium]HOR63547.1 NAD(P)-dependent oxidoreductase [Candidatus Sumerlaeota bacterium]HPL73513.1 NAD(P)-dependent oxidoreductase [Candidatus Sumerlaeota bacterium]